MNFCSKSGFCANNEVRFVGVNKSVKPGIFLLIDWKFMRANLTQVSALGKSLIGFFFAGVDRGGHLLYK